MANVSTARSAGRLSDDALRGFASEARRMLAPVRRDMLDLLQQLIRLDSTATPPDGKEAAAQHALARVLRGHGLDVELYDTGFLHHSTHPYVRRNRNYRGRPNLLARYAGTGGSRSLLFSGHIDTVPAGRGTWDDSPWSGTIRGDRIYGRGAFDMKGGLAAQFAVLLALKQAKVRLRGDLLAESVVDEEWAGGGGTLAARLRGIRADACVIPEGTGLSIVRATRGGFFVDLSVRAGDATAYFSSQEVISPALPMGRLLAWVDGWVQKRRKTVRRGPYATFEDPAPVQVLALEANRFDPDTPWATPLEARLRLYFQFLPSEDPAAVVATIRASLKRFCRHDPFFRHHPPQWSPIVEPPLLGHELSARHPWTQCLSRAASAVVRRPAVISAAEYPCDAFLNQREFGIPTLVFGPTGAGAHNVNEYAGIRSVHLTAQTLLAAALAWCDRPL